MFRWIGWIRWELIMIQWRQLLEVDGGYDFWSYR